MEKQKFELPFGYIFDESGQILLLKRIDRKSWEPVKWWMEEWEQPKDTILREMLEETGLWENDILEFYYDWERIVENAIFNRKTSKKVFFVFYIKVKWINPYVKINNIEDGWIDHNWYWWFEYKELDDLYIEYPGILDEIKKWRLYFSF